MVSALLHAPTLSRPLSLSNPSLSSRSSMPLKARIAVVGDVHNFWHLEEDTKALEFLQPDLVLFTGRFYSRDRFIYSELDVQMVFWALPIYLVNFGDINSQVAYYEVESKSIMRELIDDFAYVSVISDFGEENVELVQSVADLNFPKAVILGNHDAWYTQQFSGKKKDGVQLQLESLGEAHVGYKCLDFPLVKLSVVGGRPFSCGGGGRLFRKKLLSARYGVEDMEGSAKKIHKAVLRAPEDHFLILLAHNGPTGLGSNYDDICGKDWVFEAGDHGDSDLEQAISLLKDSNGISVPLVVFGHMHKQLARGNGLRKMIVVGSDDTIYLNGAVVPRVRPLADEQSTSNSLAEDMAGLSLQGPKGTLRAFTVVDILDGRVNKITESWVSVVGNNTKLEEEHLLFKRNNN